jgi:hypothetical protein
VKHTFQLGASELALAVRCVGCGYALRGLPPESRCPECGLEIRATLAALRRWRYPWLAAIVHRFMQWLHRPLPALARNSRSWRRTVALAPLTLALLVPVLVIWARWREDIPWWERVPEYPLLAITVPFAAAVWLLTRPDRPRQRQGPIWSFVRWALRIVGLSPALAAGLAAYSEVVPAHEHARYAGMAVSLFMLMPVLLFLLFDYLAYLAARAWADWTALFFRAAMLLVSPLLATIMTLHMTRRGYFEPRLLYPDILATSVESSLTCFGIGGVYVLLFGAALVRLSVAIWRLPKYSEGGHPRADAS